MCAVCGVLRDVVGVWCCAFFFFFFFFFVWFCVYACELWLDAFV